MKNILAKFYKNVLNLIRAKCFAKTSTFYLNLANEGSKDAKYKKDAYFPREYANSIRFHFPRSLFIFPEATSVCVCAKLMFWLK